MFLSSSLPKFASSSAFCCTVVTGGLVGLLAGAVVHGQPQLPQVSQSWVRIKGNETLNANGIYGTLRTPSVNNVPGGRRGHAVVMDQTRQLIYVFGGNGLSTVRGKKTLMTVETT